MTTKDIAPNIKAQYYKNKHIMSSGGLLDLVAHGVQDIFLIGNPQITLFRMLYKRHTNFAIESIEIPLIGDPDFGKRFTCIISPKGDLLSSLFLEIDLPQISARTVDPAGGASALYDVGRGAISWINNIGHGVIDHIDIRIGKALIDRQYGEWMEIWSELSHELGRKSGLDAMLSRSQNPGIDGSKPVIMEGPRTVIIPLQFWFCRNIGLALPLIALQYHSVELEFYMHPLSRCYTFGPNYYYLATGTQGATALALVKVNNNTADATTFKGRIIRVPSLGNNTGVDAQYYTDYSANMTGNGTSGSPYLAQLESPLETDYVDRLVYISYNGTIALDVGTNAAPKMSDVRLYGDFVYLDIEEREQYAKNKQRYLIEQIQYRESETINVGTLDSKYNVRFNLPIKELVWVIQRNDVALSQDYFNFSHAVDPAIVRDNILVSGQLVFNGTQRFSSRNGDYFRLTVPFQRHTRVPNDFVYMYSFAVKPEEYQPSGSSNFSKLNTVELSIKIRNNMPHCQLRIYGISYNVLRIMNGMGSVAFAN